MWRDFAAFVRHIGGMAHALLIDGENLSAGHAVAIFAAVPTDVQVRRVYGDTARLNGWLLVPGLRPVHAAPGRNAADILLAVEAMDLLHRERVKGFTVATSDGGLVHLLGNLREAGAVVTLVGEAKACAALRAVAHRFVELVPIKPVQAALPPPPKAATPLPPGPLEIISAHLKSAGSGGIRISELSHWLQKLRPTDLADWLGVKGPRAFLEAHPDRFEVDRELAGAPVRLVTASMSKPR